MEFKFTAATAQSSTTFDDGSYDGLFQNGIETTIQEFLITNLTKDGKLVKGRDGSPKAYIVMRTGLDSTASLEDAEVYNVARFVSKKLDRDGEEVLHVGTLNKAYVNTKAEVKAASANGKINADTLCKALNDAFKGKRIRFHHVTFKGLYKPQSMIDVDLLD